MGFDWVTFCAELVNLAILVWLLKRFLYHPILEIIDKRRAQISASVREAEEKLNLASQQEKLLNQQIKSFESERQKRLNQLDKEIAQMKEEQTLHLQERFQQKQAQLQESLHQQLDKNQQQIRQMVSEEFMTLAQTVLKEWSQKTPIEQVLVVFKDKLASLSKKKQEDIKNILKNENVVTFSSSERLTTKQRSDLMDFWQENFDLSHKTKIRFTTNSSLILGIEMRLGTFLLDWNLKAYLDELEQNLIHRMDTLTGLKKGK